MMSMKHQYGIRINSARSPASSSLDDSTYLSLWYTITRDYVRPRSVRIVPDPSYEWSSLLVLRTNESDVGRHASNAHA
jgi:hypothetical protein